MIITLNVFLSSFGLFSLLAFLGRKNLLFYIILVLMPLWVIISNSMGHQYEQVASLGKAVLIILLTVSLVVESLLAKRTMFKYIKNDGVMILWIIYCIFLLAYKPTYVGLIDFISTFEFAPLYILVFLMTKVNKEKIEKTIMVIIWTGVIISIIGIIQHYFFKSTTLLGIYESGYDINYRQITSLFGHSSNLAPFLVMICLLCISRIMKGRSIKSTLLELLGFTVGIIALYYTFSRRSWVALIICMILFLFKVRKKYFILIGFVILILILVVFNSSIPVQRLLSIFSFSQPSNVARINEIVTVNNLLQGNFWSLLFGEGLGAIRPFYGLLSEYNWMNFYTHNYYLKLIVNQGVIGLLFFLSFNLNLVNKAISLVDPKGTSLGLTLACISLLITGLFGLVFENFPLDFYYWLFTGTLRAIIIIDKQENAEHAT
jgi:O-antigen ligase